MIRLDFGKQAQLAKAAGLSPQMLNDILHGRKKCPAFTAIKLAAESREITGEFISTDEWILAGLGLRKEFAHDTETDVTAEG